MPLFSLFFVPARLSLVIRVPALVRGRRLLFAALLVDVAEAGVPADDGVLLFHSAPLGSGGGFSELVTAFSVWLPPLKPLSLIDLSPDVEPPEPSRLIGLNCPGVRLPLTPRLARLLDEPMRSLLAAAALLVEESKTSVLLLSK